MTKENKIPEHVIEEVVICWQDSNWHKAVELGHELGLTDEELEIIKDKHHDYERDNQG